jgi:hypothetical protein
MVDWKLLLPALEPLNCSSSWDSSLHLEKPELPDGIAKLELDNEFKLFFRTSPKFG